MHNYVVSGLEYRNIYKNREILEYVYKHMYWNTGICTGIMVYVLEYSHMYWNTGICTGILDLHELQRLQLV